MRGETRKRERRDRGQRLPMGECASSRDEKDELKCERARAQRRMMIDRLSRGLEFDFSFRRREECILYTTTTGACISFSVFFFLLPFLFPYSVCPLPPPKKVDVEFSDCAQDPILSVSDPGDFPDARIRSQLKGVIGRGRAGGLSHERSELFQRSRFFDIALGMTWRFLDETRAINTSRVRFCGLFPPGKANFVR